MRYLNLIFFLSLSFITKAQIPTDSVRLKPVQEIANNELDTSLRIVNFSPFFSLHVDSSLNYKFQINKIPKKYYWYLKDAPAGFKMDKDDGALSFRSNKSLFLSGRLKYDKEYPVSFGVQNLSNPHDKLDTTLKVIFYNTDIVYPQIKPSVVSPVTITEGTKLSFTILCQNGNFPIDKVLLSSDVSIGNFKLPKTCDDSFEWIPGYDFVNEKDPNKEKSVTLMFIGTTNFNYTDSAKIRVIVKDGLNYDIANNDYKNADSSMRRWIRTLKITFVQLDRKLRKTRNVRATFDITTASTGVGATVVGLAGKPNNPASKILPGTGVLLTPIREASAPNKTAEQNQAALIRSNIKRLEYILSDNRISNDRDPAIATKTNTLKTELRQSQVQLVDVPTEVFDEMSDKDLDNYINSRKVSKKYRLR
ncbi:MAG TPA: hypothetical protein PK191_01210 [Niabella sp.]|nr:hypothetical protein [Niabella sp.]HOZ97706.1 hypothetical protein [Niabella sp.]HQW14012.1 hypothetical protein [Niabella sp.]HQX19445.1 hypothetical protein [Niabella sp.]HQX40202.1 hypothetical protein [Niabella sp.]